MKALFLAALLTLTAVQAEAQTLRIGLRQDPDLLDPTLGSSYVGRIVRRDEPRVWEAPPHRRPRGLVEAIGFVEDESAGHSVGADLGEHVFGHA